MEARAEKSMGRQQADLPAATGARVRPPSWADLAISAVIVAFATGAFVGFFVWLARTQ